MVSFRWETSPICQTRNTQVCDICHWQIDVVGIGGFATSGFGAKTGHRRFIGHKRESSGGNVAKEPTVFGRKETLPTAASHPPP